MSEAGKMNDPRRSLLLAALGAGAFGAGFGTGNATAQGIFGGQPARLPEGRSIYRVEGAATVNGTPATLQSVVQPGDTVETGANSELIFVVGTQAMIMRGNTRMVLEGGRSAAASVLLTGLRLLSGKLLAVSRNQPMTVNTVTATIGIRGTGWYAEAEPDLTYFCTCYGTTVISSSSDPSSRETVTASRHDRPLYIAGKAAPGQALREAPFINHTDLELMLIETLVGRTPPFVFPRDDYNAPRRGY